MTRILISLLLLIQGLHSLSINSSLLLIDEDFPLHSDLPVTVCPKTARIIDGDPSGIFYLHPLDNSPCASLRLNSPLDADARPSDGSSFISFSLLLAESSKSRVSLDIQVIDVNDNPPTLIDPPPFVKIPADLPRGGIITTFTSFDADSGIFGLPRYSILPKTSSISIHRGSSDGAGRWKGELILEEGVREATPFTLSIHDGDPTGGISHETKWNFTLLPHDSSVQSPPKFSSIVGQSIVIPLDVPIGSTVFSLREDSDQEERVYAIEDNEYLRVDNHSGEIILLKRPESEDEKHMRVKVTDPASRLYLQETIRVAFKTVSLPTEIEFLLEPEYNFTVQEETMSYLPLVDPLPSGISLSISSLPPNIPLIVEGGNLRLGKIDRDLMTDDLLSFKIKAVTDYGKSLSESTVFIRVEDINDHPPIFSQTNYTFGLTKEGAERKEGGVFIGRIRVGDDDATDPFNHLSIYTRDPRLRIDPDGSVFTTKEIKDEEMVVRIFATDGGTPNKTASTIVQVRLVEEEEITIFPGQKTVEWSGVGERLMKYSILRMNAPLYNEDEVNEWIEINEKEGQIILKKEVPATQVSLFILLKAERDETPRTLLLLFPHNDLLSFSEKEYTVFVSSPSNQSVFDASLMKRVDNVTYSLESFPSPPPFSIDEYGSIHWISSLFPSLPWMNGSLVVRDGKGREDRAKINFRFQSTNLHPPQFSSSSFIVFLSLPSPSGRLLPLPSPPAIDLDPGDRLVYSIEDPSSLFSVNSSSGRVSVAREIKEEGTYSFWLIVNDNGGMQPSHLQKMKVEVKAQLEGDAVGMKTNLQGLSAHSNDGVGSIVTKLDYSGEMKLISTDRHFRVNERRELIVAESLEESANQKICAHLQAGAQSIPFCVNVLNNDSLPIVSFPSPDSIHLVEEGRMMRVIEIKLAPSSPQATFRLQNHSHAEWDWLSLSPTGVLSTLRPLDQAKTPLLPVRLSVCSLSSSCLPLSFTLKLIDVNDHCPVFETTSMEASINENETRTPLHVLSIQPAIDRDTEERNRNNCYSIDSPLFFFHPASSLSVHTNTSFDREITPVIKFNILVFDCNSNCTSLNGQTNSTMSITLKINNVNDNYPRFSSRVRHLTIVGGTTLPAGTQMAVLTAADADNEQLTYSIKGSIRTNETVLPPSHAPFFINSSSGLLLSRSSLPSSSYSFTLSVRDGGGHEDEMDVHITAISLDQQSEIFFDIPFDTFLQKEDEITSLLSSSSSLSAVIDKCRQSGNSTVVLLHFMDGAAVADIDTAIESLHRSPSPSIIQLRTVYGMRLETTTKETYQSPLTRLLFSAAGILLFLFSLIFLLILCRSKRDAKSSPLTNNPVKRSPYWSEISAPVISKTSNETLQSTEL